MLGEPGVFDILVCIGHVVSERLDLLGRHFRDLDVSRRVEAPVSPVECDLEIVVSVRGGVTFGETLFVVRPIYVLEREGISVAPLRELALVVCDVTVFVFGEGISAALLVPLE